MKHVVAALLFLLIVHQGIAQDEEVVVEFIEAPAVEETGIEIFNNGSMRGLRDGNGIILPAEYNAITASDADDLYIVQKEGPDVVPAHLDSIQRSHEICICDRDAIEQRTVANQQVVVVQAPSDDAWSAAPILNHCINDKVRIRVGRHVVA